jgi:DNA-binding response OmpR family regulator
MKKILIVEDEQDVRNILKSALERQKQFIVDTAEDGEEAIQKIQDSTPDLIVLDLMLPKINGEELLKLIRKNFKTLNTPVIVSTVEKQTSSLVNLMNLGATDYLAKPYNIEELLRTVDIYV